MKPSWQSTTVALAFIALVGVMFWRAMDATDFAKVWAAVGTIVGVVIGAIPSFFFASRAEEAKTEADQARREEAALQKKVRLYATYLPPDKIQMLKQEDSEIFS